ncbi:hypothetical protein ES703_50863 [subsurface metagenome]
MVIIQQASEEIIRFVKLLCIIYGSDSERLLSFNFIGIKFHIWIIIITRHEPEKCFCFSEGLVNSFGPDWNTMSPPELSAYRPVAEVFQPGLVGFGVAFGDKSQATVKQRLQGQAGQRVHRYIRVLNKTFSEPFRKMLDRFSDLDIPLVGQIRLDRDVTAIAVSDFVGVFANVFKKILRSKPLDNRLTRLETVHPEQRLRFRLIGISPAEFIANRTIRRHHIDDFQSMPLANLPIIRVVRWCNFQKAGRKSRLFILAIRVGQNDMLIGHDGDDATYNWKPHLFTNQIFSTLVCRVHRNSRIAKHCLRPGRGDGNILNPFTGCINRFNKWIPQIPEMSLHQLVFDFIVGQYCLRSRVPVDKPFASID